MPAGRPPVVTPDIIEQVFSRMAEGESERSIFRDPDMPAWSTWTLYKHKNVGDGSNEFSVQYAHAREAMFESIAENLVTFASDESRDLQPDGKGGFKSDNTAVNRDRLKVDTWKWLLSKRCSKKYGDKVSLEAGKDTDLSVQINLTTKTK